MALTISEPLSSQGLLDVSSKPARLPCNICRAIVPDRSAVDETYIRTPYHRVDLYPDFPGLKASAEAGCCLCALIRDALTFASSPEGRRLAKGENICHPFWDEGCGQDMILTMAWDRCIDISVWFQVTPFSPSGGPETTPPGRPSLQTGEMVDSMRIQYKPSSGRVVGNKRDFWDGSVIFLSVFDSPG